ncbi:hypothetical protein BGZ80_002746 [Entomortierella chlamydospora]|uniref:Crinkler effector protein N-terminal domain-containing protein n=1 Tax=Entomortierella chlamydospora TaxID=101097 RepID=A0A9P6SX40_9FUNG|nr:hypothetical protein BGZ80_002746 [Entomortierella chlamydospora]
MTSEKVKLFCILEGDSTAFKVTVALDDDVDDLKKAIKKEKSKTLSDIDASDLILWRIAVPSSPARTIRLNNLTSDDTKNMLPQKLDESDDLISDKFEAIPPKKTIHIIVQLPTAAASGLTRSYALIFDQCRYSKSTKFSVVPTCEPTRFTVSSNVILNALEKTESRDVPVFGVR